MRKNILLLLVAASVAAPAQTTNHVSRDLFSIDCPVTTFFRDAEFFMPYTKGYTASGFRLQPSVHYNDTNARVSITAGALFTGIAGINGTSAIFSDGLWKIQPVLTLDYRPLQWLTLTMGTLHGSTEHRMPSPLYDPERWIYDYQENGLQIRTGTRRWESDTWVNWENFLVPWTPDQERFTLASRHRITLFGDGDNGYAVSLPLAFTGSHRGGQFTTLDTCIETLFNEYAAVNLRLAVGSMQLTAEAPLYFFQNLSPTPHTHYLDGHAFYPSLEMSMPLTATDSPVSRRLSLKLGYWQAHHFLSARGSWLFQCASWHDPDFKTPERHMLTADIILDSRRGPLGLNLNATIYYDLDRKATDFVAGLSMDITPKVRF